MLIPDSWFLFPGFHCRARLLFIYISKDSSIVKANLSRIAVWQGFCFLVAFWQFNFVHFCSLLFVRFGLIFVFRGSDSSCQAALLLANVSMAAHLIHLFRPLQNAVSQHLFVSDVKIHSASSFQRRSRPASSISHRPFQILSSPSIAR